MAPDDNTNYASECARLAELTDNQSLRDDLVALALDWMEPSETITPMSSHSLGEGSDGLLRLERL
jgi:hypothetical protein